MASPGRGRPAVSASFNRSRGSKLWRDGHKMNSEVVCEDAGPSGPRSGRMTPAMSGDETPFWRRKSMAEMTHSDWETRCDGCARCCLVTLPDADHPPRTHVRALGGRLLRANP